MEYCARYLISVVMNGKIMVSFAVYMIYNFAAKIFLLRPMHFN